MAKTSDKLDLGLTVKFTRVFDTHDWAYKTYFVVRGCWYRNQTLVAVEYNNRIRWLGKVVPLP